MIHKPTYISWYSMKSRCNNKNVKCFSRYGGRGIKYSSKWETFQGFLEDMGERIQGTTLDRKNNDGDYCKENCRWATHSEQMSNRNNFAVTINNLKRKNKFGRGVSIKPNGKYQAMVKGKYLGVFNTIKEAQEAYDKTAYKIFKNKEVLNVN